MTGLSIVELTDILKKLSEAKENIHDTEVIKLKSKVCKLLDEKLDEESSRENINWNELS